jgi:spore coat polysaccharide biosynthesis protein SpsF (cytidylyltransferase family)
VKFRIDKIVDFETAKVVKELFASNITVQSLLKTKEKYYSSDTSLVGTTSSLMNVNVALQLDNFEVDATRAEEVQTKMRRKLVEEVGAPSTDLKLKLRLADEIDVWSLELEEKMFQSVTKDLDLTQEADARITNTFVMESSVELDLLDTVFVPADFITAISLDLDVTPDQVTILGPLALANYSSQDPGGFTRVKFRIDKIEDFGTAKVVKEQFASNVTVQSLLKTKEQYYSSDTSLGTTSSLMNVEVALQLDNFEVDATRAEEIQTELRKKLVEEVGAPSTDLKLELRLPDDIDDWTPAVEEQMFQSVTKDLGLTQEADARLTNTFVVESSVELDLSDAVFVPEDFVAALSQDLDVTPDQVTILGPLANYSSQGSVGGDGFTRVRFRVDKIVDFEDAKVVRDQFGSNVTVQSLAKTKEKYYSSDASLVGSTSSLMNINVALQLDNFEVDASRVEEVQTELRKKLVEEVGAPSTDLKLELRLPDDIDDWTPAVEEQMFQSVTKDLHLTQEADARLTNTFVVESSVELDLSDAVFVPEDFIAALSQDLDVTPDQVTILGPLANQSTVGGDGFTRVKFRIDKIEDFGTVKVVKELFASNITVQSLLKTKEQYYSSDTSLVGTTSSLMNVNVALQLDNFEVDATRAEEIQTELRKNLVEEVGAPSTDLKLELRLPDDIDDWTPAVEEQVFQSVTKDLHLTQEADARLSNTFVVESSVELCSGASRKSLYGPSTSLFLLEALHTPIGRWTSTTPHRMMMMAPSSTRTRTRTVAQSACALGVVGAIVGVRSKNEGCAS